jgi:hypothetical protein
MGATSIKAIETRYAGCLFLSRLEARWAVFFDTLGIRWQYELQGYELPSGKYLCDFYLPDVNGGTWFEVKGKAPTENEQLLAAELSQATGQVVLIASGDIPRDAWEQEESMYWHWTGSFDWHYMWCICRHCRGFGARFEGRAARLGCGCYGPHDDKGYNSDDPRLLQAYEAARSARFEHGQSGAR